MGKFTALADAVSDALAAFSAAEIDTPNDLDDIIQGLAAIAEDFSWPFFRHAERLHEMPGLVRWVPDTLWEAGMDAHEVAMRTEELAGFRLVKT